MNDCYSALCDGRWVHELDIGQLLDLGYTGKVTRVICVGAVYDGIDANWVMRAVAKGV